MHQPLLPQGRRFERRPCHHPLTFDTLIVSRRVTAGPARIEALVDDCGELPTTLPDGSTFALGSMAPTAALVGTTWRGPLSIRRAGLHVFRHLRAHVEITSWSAGSAEVRISPASRHVRNWGARRLRRYFVLVHATADHLWRTLQEPLPAAAPTATAQSFDSAA